MSHIVVLVLGDIGRSPRMQYHAVSFSNSPGVKQVSLVGYAGEDPTKDVQNNKNIKVVPLKLLLAFEFLRRIAILHAVVKGMMLVVSIFYTLLTIPRYDLIIVQNPPCLPAVISAYIISIVNGSKIMIDWHNLGYAMFQQRKNPSQLLIKVARYLERIVTSSCGSYHICVSQAMKDWLFDNFGLEATVLYDRPAKMFQKISVPLHCRHDLFTKLELTESALYSSSPVMSSNASVCSDEGSVISTNSSINSNNGETIQTTMKKIKKSTHYRPRTDARRAGLLISSTSWTDDEDFNIFLQALIEIEEYLEKTHFINGVPKGYYSRLVVVITGKGPNKDAFLDEVAKHKWNHVKILTLWVSFADYALLMRCADLGVCLHTSTSGLDLPMKVYDMLGSGVPVCAIKFKTLGVVNEPNTLQELVQHDVNGLIFEKSKELASQCIRLLINPKYKSENCSNAIIGKSSLTQMRTNATDLGQWDENWNKVMCPLLSKFVN